MRPPEKRPAWVTDEMEAQDKAKVARSRLAQSAAYDLIAAGCREIRLRLNDRVSVSGLPGAGGLAVTRARNTASLGVAYKVAWEETTAARANGGWVGLLTQRFGYGPTVVLFYDDFITLMEQLAKGDSPCHCRT